MSVAESQVSIFDGLVDGDLNELRGQRTALSEDHRALMAEYARMSAIDPDLRVDHQREFDSFRQDWFRKVMKFVNLVRASYAAGRMSDTHFTSSVEYVDEVLRPRWAQTRFFGKTFPHVDIPSHDDIVAPPANPGEKRHLNDCSNITEAFNQPPHKAVFRSSSPNPVAELTHDEEPMATDDAAPVAGAQAPSCGTIPKVRVNDVVAQGRALPNPPSGNAGVDQWLHANPPLLQTARQSDPATPTSTTPGENATSPATSISGRRKAFAQVIDLKKQNEDMKQQQADLKRLLQENAQEAHRKLQEQARLHQEQQAAALQQGKEEMRRQAEELYKAKKIQDSNENERRQKELADQMQKNKQESEQMIAQLQQQILQTRAVATEEQSKRLRAEEAATNLARQAQQAEQSRAAAEQQRQVAEQQRIAAEQQRLQQEAAQRAQVDAFLPSTTPANNPASAFRGNARTSPAQATAPVNNELLNRQQQPPLPLNNITENETNPSTMSWMRENASTSSGASIITRLMGDCVISTDWTGVNMDTFTRLRQMDVDAMKANRPKVLFSTGDAMAHPGP